LKKYEIKFDEKYLFDWIEWTGRSYGAFMRFLRFFLQTDRPYWGFSPDGTATWSCSCYLLSIPMRIGLIIVVKPQEKYW